MKTKRIKFPEPPPRETENVKDEALAIIAARLRNAPNYVMCAILHMTEKWDPPADETERRKGGRSA